MLEAFDDDEHEFSMSIGEWLHHVCYGLSDCNAPVLIVHLCVQCAASLVCGILQQMNTPGRLSDRFRMRHKTCIC